MSSVQLSIERQDRSMILNLAIGSGIDAIDIDRVNFNSFTDRDVRWEY